MLDVEVKLKSFYSAHRVPGGLPSRAYVITVHASGPDGPYTLWHGPRVPPSMQPGVVFARKMVDKNGDVTGDPAKAVDLIEDDRLQHHRFSVDHFLFEVKEGEPVTVKATLHYLPNFPSWRGSEEIWELEKRR